MTRDSLARPARVAVAGLVLVASAWYLWTRFDWHEIGRLLAGARYGWFFFGCGALYVAYLAVRTARWLLLIRSANVAVRFSDLYLPTAVMVSFSLLTPAGIGETSKVEFLKRRGLLGRTAGLGSFLVERVVDLLVVVSLAAASLPATPLLAGRPAFYWFLGGIGALGLAALIGLRFVAPGGRLGRILDSLRVAAGNRGTLAGVVGLSIVSWILVALGWQVALASAGVRLPLVEVIAVMTVTTLVSIASFIPGGVGISEVMIATLLRVLGVDATHAQAGAIALRLYGLYLVTIGLVHLAYWWLRRPAVVASCDP